MSSVDSSRPRGAATSSQPQPLTPQEKQFLVPCPDCVAGSCSCGRAIDQRDGSVWPAEDNGYRTTDDKRFLRAKAQPVRTAPIAPVTVPPPPLDPQAYDSFFYPDDPKKKKAAKSKKPRKHDADRDYRKGARSTLIPGERKGWCPPVDALIPSPESVLPLFSDDGRHWIGDLTAAGIDKYSEKTKHKIRKSRPPYDVWPPRRETRPRDRFDSPPELRLYPYMKIRRTRAHVSTRLDQPPCGPGPQRSFPSKRSAKRSALAAMNKEALRIFKREAPGVDIPERLKVQFQTDNGMRWSIERPCSLTGREIPADARLPIQRPKKMKGVTMADLPEEKRPYMRVLLLHQYAGLSEREIASVLGLSRRQVQLMRIRANDPAFWPEYAP